MDFGSKGFFIKNKLKISFFVFEKIKVMPKKTFILGILIGLFILEACNNGKEELREPPIKYDKMVLILRDVHIAEGSMQGVVQVKKDSIAHVHYAHIFKIHGITEDEFYESYDFHVENPKLMEKMYEEIKDSIQKKVIVEE